MSLSMNSLVFAADQSSAETEIPADNYQYAQGASVALNVSSSGVARIHAQLTGKTQATKLAATVILQKYNHGIWSRVDAWTDTTKSSELIIKKSVNISKGTYRVYAMFHAYDGKKDELINRISKSVKY